MIRLTYRDLNNYPMITVLKKLIDTPGFSSQVAYNIALISRKIDQAVNRARGELKERVQNMLELDPAGNPQTTESGEPKIKDGLQDAYRKTYEAFLQTPVEILYHKLSLSDLNNKGLTPNEFLALEPMIEIETISDDALEQIA